MIECHLRHTTVRHYAPKVKWNEKNNTARPLAREMCVYTKVQTIRNEIVDMKLSIHELRVQMDVGHFTNTSNNTRIPNIILLANRCVRINTYPNWIYINIHICVYQTKHINLAWHIPCACDGVNSSACLFFEIKKKTYLYCFRIWKSIYAVIENK